MVSFPWDVGTSARDPREEPGSGLASQIRQDESATANPAGEALLLSIVIPTRNEAPNVSALLRRLAPVVEAYDSEIIFVDDSNDHTPDIVREEAESFVRPIRLIHRPVSQRTGGLGEAVVTGMRSARGTWVLVMDADLQHPPEIIPKMVGKALGDTTDLVIANRYCEGGSTGNFAPMRLLTSKGTTWVAKAMFPHRLRQVDDPMTGFFMVRRDALDLDTFRPNGFKILLEIVTRTPHLRIDSVPFVFGERHAGESKATVREGIRFFSLLCTLRFGAGFTRFASFGAVGLSGLVVNTALLALWTDVIGLYYMLSLLLATQGSSIWNFLLSEHVVFSSLHRREGELGRAAMFLIMNNVALLARGPIVFCLTSLLGVNYLASNVVSMVLLLVVRYALADTIIWKRQTVGSPVTPS